MSYGNKCGHAKAFDSGIAGAEFITSTYLRTPTMGEINPYILQSHLKEEAS